VLEYEVVAFVDDDPAKRDRVVEEVTVRGTVDELPDIVRAVSADQVFVAIPSLGQDGTLAMMSRCMRAQVPAPRERHPHLLVSDTSVETIDGVPTYDIAPTPRRSWVWCSRAFDIAVSGALLMFAPLLLAIPL
jgi:FlaA1/EpsC-like NDP-sugar epimerase